MIEYLCGVLSGIFVGAAGKYFADKYTDKRKSKEYTFSRQEAFTFCEQQMTDLFKEMREDLKKSPLSRKIILLHKKTHYCLDKSEIRFHYYFEDHKQLKEKFQILESNSFVEDIKENKIDSFCMSEEFVELLTS